MTEEQKEENNNDALEVRNLALNPTQKVQKK